MRIRLFAPLALLLLLPLAASEAAEEGRTSFTLVSRHQGGAYWWALEGNDTKDPELVVPAGANVTVTVRNGDGVLHNFQVEGHPASAFVTAVGDETTYTFTAPQSGSVRYWCAPHKSNGMGGVVRVAGSPAGEIKESGPASQLAGVAFALVAAALVARRRA